jgi:hypothetical protein
LEIPNNFRIFDSFNNELVEMAVYKKDGKWGKLKGFDYYLRSEGYISLINEMLTEKIPYMDPKLSDNELMEIWNEIWDKWGCVIDDFKDKWLKEKL